MRENPHQSRLSLDYLWVLQLLNGGTGLLKLHYFILVNLSKNCRGAENRTRISRSQSAYTTTVLHPAILNYTLKITQLVGVPGIEPGSHAPEARILPLYYTPLGKTSKKYH